ncbi:MAG: radical SAM protein [Sandaracinaceae bacterium]
MDVALILTHRCNLACGYCYAGEHHKTDLDDSVLQRGVDLLFSDGSGRAQLSFFGGEPFLNFDAMQRAVELAEARARSAGAQLTIQCTTNGSLLREEHVRFLTKHGVHVTVSIDGVREAHDHNRPCAGGKPSFDQVHGGLRRLLDAGVPCDAMMVITPDTASYAFISTNFLWSEGVRTIRANIAVDESWTDETRTELREQLVSIGWEVLARRLKNEPISFKPFEAGIRAFDEAAEPFARATDPRRKVVVATSGNLYPCAPMVGEDRDTGKEASLRLGHIDEGPAVIAQRVAQQGVSCDRGKACQCAAYLETGDRYTPGRIGRWYGQVCSEIGHTIAESLARAQLAPKKPASRGRRAMIGLSAIVGAAALGAPLMLLGGEEELPRPCALRTRKQVGMRPDTDYAIAGEMPAYPEPPEPEVFVEGGVSEPIEPPPPREPEPAVDGEMPIEVLGDVEY